jgi:3-oxoacyl-[acyl-carrier protein] reductase
LRAGEIIEGAQIMQERVAIITGASSGIGAATARLIADQYGGLILHARKSANALERVAAEARDKGAKVATILCDLTDEQIGLKLVEEARARFGRLDAVIANAGFPILKSFEEGGSSDLDYAFRGNVFSFFSITRAAAQLIEASPVGRIVAVGSFTSHVFRTDLLQVPLSAASKGALETAVRSLAMHFARVGVTVNCVVPGLIEKEAGTEDSVSESELAASRARIPLGRIGHPDDVAAAIKFLVSDNASYITGQSIHVNGGLHIC